MKKLKKKLSIKQHNDLYKKFLKRLYEDEELFLFFEDGIITDLYDNLITTVFCI